MRKLNKMNDLDMKRAELEAYLATGGYVIDFLMLQIVLLEQRVKELESEAQGCFCYPPEIPKP